MRRQIAFAVCDDDNIEGAMTAYAREWLLLAAAELPQDKRTLTALAEAVGSRRQRLARWLDALGIREQIDQM